jgi:ketosteroid isomerase-like protein
LRWPLISAGIAGVQNPHTPLEKRSFPLAKLVLALAATVLAAGTLRAADSDDVAATLRQLISSFDKGDSKSILAKFADNPTIVDEFEPFYWHGTGAAEKWFRDMDASNKKDGITDGSVQIGKARYITVAGDNAYVVMPADFSYKLQGKPAEETAAIWTLTLRKGKTGWKVMSSSWAKP